MKMKKSVFLALCMFVPAVCFGADAAPVTVSSYFSWFTANWGLVAALWLAVEQILAATAMKSNSTFQIVCNIIDAIVTKKQTPAA